MQTIVLIMTRRPIAQSFMENFKDDPNTHSVYTPDYDHAGAVIHAHHAGVALIEVGEAGDYDAAYCLALCGRLRRATPQCKLVLMCPEQNESGVLAAVNAKKSGQIDDFVFYDASLAYLTSKLLSML